MSELFFRTEDIRPDEVLDYFVESKSDREIVDLLKGRNPVVLAGSRGVGKSFLLRVAEAELLNALADNRIFPVYVTFSMSSLINTSDPLQFQHWMLAKICARLIRAISTKGMINVAPQHTISILTGDTSATPNVPQISVERISEQFENSWKAEPPPGVDLCALPSTDSFKDAIEDLCDNLKLRRIIILIDEAAHILLPEQQRQFFSLFRDLRSPYLSCKAAVYPGVTSYGSIFQPIHDATMLALDRDVMESKYVSNMREIVQKQAESSLLRQIEQHGENFASLAYAASGNPRVLLKTLARASRVTAQQTNEVIREYYRAEIWSEHSTLTDKYPGHRELIDWGRQFIENDVLPDIQKKNIQYLEADKSSTCFFWIHRDAPQAVKEALRLLAYTGIVREHASGIKATRGEVGTRYAVNLGCLLALEATPTATALRIVRSLTPKRMSEFGANHSAYKSLLDAMPTFAEPDAAHVLKGQLDKSVEVLDITDWQRQGLVRLGLNTVGDVLHASETKLQEIAYVGEVRSRRMRNAAIAAVYEYLSG
jgi:hypothetical protein